MEIDLLTTSVGRDLIRETYSAALENLDFDGPIHVGVVVDPAYRVDQPEIEATVSWLHALPERDRRIASVTVRVFNRNVGLQRAILTLLTLARCRYALYLEDDWRCLGRIAPDALVDAMRDLDAGMIALTSPTAAARGTFERPEEVERARAAGLDLFRLRSPSWAADYMPLHPHMHDARRWPATYVQALMEDDTPARCPDERVRDWVRLHRAHDLCPVYWTKDILVEDIGREWLAARALAKDIGPGGAAKLDLPPRPGRDASHARSIAYHGRALRVIPGETQTFMKRRRNFPEKGFPVVLASGDGAIVHDVDGNGYIDMIAGLGALSLGHKHPAIEAGVDAQRALGHLHSLPTLAEIEAAEAVSALEPSTPAVRFFKNGGDATAAAIRLARASTGREHFLSCGYHGCGDAFMTGTPGVPSALAPLRRTVDPFADSGPQSLEACLAPGEPPVAAFILALPYHRVMPAERLRALRERVRAAGALFVLDEIVTGIRFESGSVASRFGLEPDLICWGKSLAAGYPLAALTMRADLAATMANLHVSSTYGGDAVSLSVCRSVLGYCRSTDYARRMAAAGTRLRDAVNHAASGLRLDPVVVGYPALPFFRLSPDPATHVARMRILQAAAAAEGVLLREDLNFVTDGFTDEIVDVAAERICAALTRAARMF